MGKRKSDAKMALCPKQRRKRLPQTRTPAWTVRIAFFASAMIFVVIFVGVIPLGFFTALAYAGASSGLVLALIFLREMLFFHEEFLDSIEDLTRKDEARPEFEYFCINCRKTVGKKDRTCPHCQTNFRGHMRMVLN